MTNQPDVGPFDHAPPAHGGAFFEEIGTSFTHLERRSDVINADVLDAWYDPVPSVLDQLQDSLAWLVRTSPPVHADGLVSTISEQRLVSPDSVVVGPGSSSLMYLMLPFLARPGARVLLLDPTYGEYRYLFGSLAAAAVRLYHLAEDRGFEPDVDELARRAEDADLVVVVNPNNPTGTFLSRLSLLQLCDRLSRSTLLLLDETYVDFVDSAESLETEVTRRPNLVVLKSMSKYYALSGMRVGYAVIPKALAAQVRRRSPPWSVGLVAQVAACAALRDAEYYRDRAGDTDRLRRAYCAGLATVPGLGVVGDGANYVLLKLSDTASSATALCAELRKSHIYIRNCSSQSERFHDRFVRIAVKTPEVNSRVIARLRTILGSADGPGRS